MGMKQFFTLSADVELYKCIEMLQNLIPEEKLFYAQVKK